MEIKNTNLSIKKEQIEKLNDENLKLRYFLGGLNNLGICMFWESDINFSCLPVKDDNNLENIKKFIKKHNITDERFLGLTYNYLMGRIMRYNGRYSKFFLELEKIIKPYNFKKITTTIENNNSKEKIVEELINDIKSKQLINNFIKKYNLTIEDFIVLTKTILNNRLRILPISSPNDTFYREIIEIIEYKNEKHTVSNFQEVKIKYLELTKQLLIKYPNLISEIFNKEENESKINQEENKNVLKI